MQDNKQNSPAIGVIGGSGLYNIEGLENVVEHTVETPFGAPSDVLVEGELSNRRVVFLARHSRRHNIMPTEINHRANIWALRSLGVRWIICITAVGSLRAELEPRDIVIIDQYFDRTNRRLEHTFFGAGIVAHIAFSDPVSPDLGKILYDSANEFASTVHDGGTYVNMDGPAFSTRAESEAHRQLGFDVVGMTNLAEAKLAREAEIALATLAMVTDFDCWKTDEPPVDTPTVLGHLRANADLAKKIIARAIESIPDEPNWQEHNALSGAIMTPEDQWPPATVKKLQPILADYKTGE